MANRTGKSEAAELADLYWRIAQECHRLRDTKRETDRYIQDHAASLPAIGFAGPARERETVDYQR